MWAMMRMTERGLANVKHDKDVFLARSLSYLEIRGLKLDNDAVGITTTGRLVDALDCFRQRI